MAIAIHGPSGGGTDASGATAAAGQVLSPYTFIGAAGTLQTGTILSKTAQTYTPGTASQQIAAGQYLAGAQTIAGDTNLVAANIVSGKSIFGVAGSAAAVKGQIIDARTAMAYSKSYNRLSIALDFSAGGALAIYYTSSTIDDTNNEVQAFTLMVPPNDWDNQWWQVVYYSFTSSKPVLLTSHQMSDEQYRCSCTYDSSTNISTITIPALHGLTMPLEQESKYNANIIYF